MDSETAERVAVELLELTGKHTKLTAFISGSVFDKLPKADRILLVQQQVTMRTYGDILAKRLSIYLSKLIGG